MNVYHYTIASRLVKILTSGYLKLCPNKPEPGEIQYVWMTINPEWDRTAFYGYPTVVLDNQVRIRITIDIDLDKPNIDWNFTTAIHGDIFDYDRLVYTASLVGVHHTAWVVSKNIVPISEFTNIEYWDTNTNNWVKILNLNWSK